MIFNQVKIAIYSKEKILFSFPIINQKIISQHAQAHRHEIKSTFKMFFFGT